VAAALERWTQTPVPPPAEYIPRRGDASSGSLDGPNPARPRLAPAPPLAPSKRVTAVPTETALMPLPPPSASGLFWPLTVLAILLTAGVGLAVAVYVSFLAP
jgi:hypothetical protein